MFPSKEIFRSAVFAVIGGIITVVILKFLETEVQRHREISEMKMSWWTKLRSSYKKMNRGRGTKLRSNHKKMTTGWVKRVSVVFDKFLSKVFFCLSNSLVKLSTPSQKTYFWQFYELALGTVSHFFHYACSFLYLKFKVYPQVLISRQRRELPLHFELLW